MDVFLQDALLQRVFLANSLHNITYHTNILIFIHVVVYAIDFQYNRLEATKSISLSLKGILQHLVFTAYSFLYESLGDNLVKRSNWGHSGDKTTKPQRPNTKCIHNITEISPHDAASIQNVCSFYCRWKDSNSECATDHTVQSVL